MILKMLPENFQKKSRTFFDKACNGYCDDYDYKYNCPCYGDCEERFVECVSLRETVTPKRISKNRAISWQTVLQI